MAHPTYTITPFALREASDDALAAVNALRNELRAEREPHDPPTPVATMMHRMRNVPAFVDARAWSVSNGGGLLVAFAVIYIPITDENRHVAEFTIDVQAAHRRRGIGRGLLAHIVDAADSQHRTLLVSATDARIPAGEAVMERLGATRGIVAQTHQLDLAHLDDALVQAWIDDARTLAAGYELHASEGPYGEEELPAISALHGVMNEQPRDDLDIEDERMTPERLREIERYLFGGTTGRWTLTARDGASGDLVGFTELYLDTERPDLARQGDTGVFPDHRGKGIGRWLKASMLRKLRFERPEVRLVRTDNADSNAAMRRINEALGFEPYSANCVWQVRVDQVRAYLHARRPEPLDGSRHQVP
ncbi:MAG: N-acetyltransferase [Trueperaceae bacterium]|nr:N-acetyltransferase [Trueperaceae bacterium]